MAETLPAQLSDLIVVTEPFALILPSRRVSLLEVLRLPNPAARAPKAPSPAASPKPP